MANISNSNEEGRNKIYFLKPVQPNECQRIINKQT